MDLVINWSHNFVPHINVMILYSLKEINWKKSLSKTWTPSYGKLFQKWESFHQVLLFPSDS